VRDLERRRDHAIDPGALGESCQSHDLVLDLVRHTDAPEVPLAALYAPRELG